MRHTLYLKARRQPAVLERLLRVTRHRQFEVDTLSLAPASVTPPAQAALILTDTHSGPSLLPGLWHSVSVMGTGGGFTRSAQVRLLVGGARVYLPLTVKD